MSYTRILKQTASTLTMTWYADGTATDVGDVTVGIVDELGNTVVAAGTATTNNADGTYTYLVASSLTGTVDRWVVTWTDVDTGDDLVDTVEVVGGNLFTEADARAFDNSALTSTTTYTDAMIARERDRVTDLLEQWTGVSWIPRYGLWQGPGSGTYTLEVPHHRINTVLSVSISGTSIATSNFATMATSRVVRRTNGVWTAGTITNPYNVTVEYEHGYDRITDGVDRIAMLMLRERLVDSPIGDRALSFTDEIGTYRFQQPGAFGNVSSIPEVNDWVKRHDQRALV